MRYTGPKNRIARREAMDLGLKTPGSKSHASLLKRLAIMPGQHGTRARRKVSEYGRQVREKQKLRYMFGVTETQLKKYFQKSVKKTGNTGFFISQFLEQRLDSIVYRLGIAATRAAARQLITHRHIKINDKMLNVPSHQVRVGDVITLAKTKTVKIPQVESSLAVKDSFIPSWLERKGPAGKMVAIATSEILDKQINLRLVIEYYSR